MKMATSAALFGDINFTNSTSPSIRLSAKEPENWRCLGVEDVKEALKRKMQAHPVDPDNLDGISRDGD